MLLIPTGKQLAVLNKNLFKTSTALLFYFKDGQFVGENYLANKLTVLSIPILQILEFLKEDFKTMEEIDLQFKGLPNLEELLQKLVAAAILIQKESELEQLEEELNDWEWDLPARYYHAKTNYVSFEANNEKVWIELDNKSSKISPPLPFLKLANVEYQALRKPNKALHANIFQNLIDRRTCRSFLSQAISEEDFSNLIYYSFGKTGEYKGGTLGDVIFKTTPSGGSRHHPEIYMIVNRVDNFEQGIYHYNVNEHSLGLMEAGDFSQWGLAICSDQQWVKDCSVVFIVTSLLKRNMWKYKHAHAYRVINLDVGHLGQTFNLTCTALGLAAFGTAALNNKLIEEQLNLNPYVQPALYVLATGYPNKEDKDYAR